MDYEAIHTRTKNFEPYFDEHLWLKSNRQLPIEELPRSSWVDIVSTSKLYHDFKQYIDPATKSNEFLEKFQTAFDPPPHFLKIILQFFIMDMVAFIQGGIGQIVSVNIS